MTYDETFSRALVVLGETFNEPVSDVRMEAYADALSDLDPQSVLDAMRLCVRECQFFPRPAEIRERVLGKSEDRGEEAWTGVLEAVRRIGYTGWPSALPDASHDAIRAVWGSWGRLCETLPNEGPELLGWRKAFLAAYGGQERASARAALGSGEPLTQIGQLSPAIRKAIGR